MMNYEGNGAVQNCVTARHLFKVIGETSPSVLSLSDAALSYYTRGYYEHALSLYAQLAGLGLEAAASNAAYIADLGVSVDAGLQLSQCQGVAKGFLRQSYDQGNMRSGVKLGDYYYYGKADLPVDMQKAAELYTVARYPRVTHIHLSTWY